MSVGERTKTGARTKKREGGGGGGGRGQGETHRHFGFLDARFQRSSGRKKETTRSLTQSSLCTKYHCLIPDNYINNINFVKKEGTDR